VALACRDLGAASVALEAGLRGRADRFAQASRAGNAALVARAVAAAGPLAGRRVLELHAGSGNLTRGLADAGATIVAVEHQPGPLADDPRVEWRVGAAERLVELMARRGERFAVAVLDPPRTGARELVAPLVHLAPDAVVYVSCDAATLGRDLDGLAAGGLVAREAWPLDLMPQTSHVEVVVRLIRQQA
jgi:23S rRNA (uracil1939-C5)-methyltransferase